MNSFSSASQMCEPFPRTINGGSPPTEPNARTGEFTPPGIRPSARCCKRRDCSTFREVVDGIEAPREKMSTNETDYYTSAGAKQINQIFTISPSFCNTVRVTWSHQPALLTGRVRGTASGAPGCPYLFLFSPLTNFTFPPCFVGVHRSGRHKRRQYQRAKRQLRLYGVGKPWLRC